MDSLMRAQPAPSSCRSQRLGRSPGAEDAPNAGALCPKAGELEAPKGLAAVAPKPPNAGLAPNAPVAPNAGALDAPNAGWLWPKAGAAPNAGAGDAPNAGWLCRQRRRKMGTTVSNSDWRRDGTAAALSDGSTAALHEPNKRTWPKTPVVVVAPKGEDACPNAGVCWPKGEGEVAPKGLELAPKPAERVWGWQRA